jgi:hypothetical protein
VGLASGSCGSAVKSDGSLFVNLACGGLYFGGGNNSVPLPATIPNQSTNYTKVTACENHALTLGPTTSDDTGSDRSCTKTGCFFGAPLPIPNTSSPQTSTCVVNTLSADGEGTANCTTGITNLNLPLNSEIFLTGDLFPADGGVDHCVGGTNAGTVCTDNSTCTGGGFCSAGIQTCPLCTGGVCRGGANDGLACTPSDSNEGPQFPTSFDCPPSAGQDIGGLPIGFALTTGTVTRTAVASGAQSRDFCGYCRDSDDTLAFENPAHKCLENGVAVSTCSGTFESCEQKANGAFGPGGGGARTITEIGSPAGDLSDHQPGHATKLVSVFCIPPTFNATVDNAADLPGPGAVALEGTSQLLP